MKKFCLVLVVSLLFVFTACGSSSKTVEKESNVDAEPAEEEITDEDETVEETAEVPDPEPVEEGKKQGELGGECYPNETCNKGLECDTKNNVCIEEAAEPEDDSDNADSGAEENTDDSDTGSETPEKTPAEKCVAAGGNWDEANSLCQKMTLCSANPLHSEYNSVDRITQTWDGTSWLPSSTAVYNDEASTTECRFKCAENYFWNDAECVSPCDPNPCESDANSTHECIAHALDQHECVCNDKYFWKDGICREPMSVGNVCTGLTKCYTNAEEISCSELGEEFSGEDAEAAEAGQCTPPSFTPGDGSIEGQVIIFDNNTRLEWQQNISTDLYTWGQAENYCGILSGGDWRLPTPKELYTIVDNSRTNPAINPDFFPGTPSGYFWSSVPFDENHVWGINFSNGSDSTTRSIASGFYNEEKAYVRCVRGEPLKNSQFTAMTVEGGDTFYTDKTTDLMWQKAYASSVNWQQALDHCKKPYAGYSDWRLPNKNELISIINFEKGTSVPLSDFPDMSSENDLYWSSTTSSAGYAWMVGYSNKSSGILSDTTATTVTTANVTSTSTSSGLTSIPHYARCVRN